jgi:hypothetical protein
LFCINRVETLISHLSVNTSFTRTLSITTPFGLLALPIKRELQRLMQEVEGLDTGLQVFTLRLTIFVDALAP